MPFELDDAIAIANQAVKSQCDRPLTNVEILLLRGVWQKLEYDHIAAQGGYATSYISQDVAPKLWRLLSTALGEKVRKSNFRTATERYADQVSTNARPLKKTAALKLDSALQSPKPRSPKVATEARSSKAIPSTVKPHTTVPSFAPRPPSASKPMSRHYYIERPLIERRFYEELLQPGALIRLKAPRFMGKTTLVSRVLSQIEQDHYRVAKLSLEMADRTVHLNDLNRFLRWLCLNISRELGLPNLLGEYWNAEEMGVKVSCTAYFEEYLLAQDDRPLVLCFDDVDLLFSHPEIYEDVLSLLRAWYEKARIQSVWTKLRLVIVHSTDVYVRVQIHQSPFNVGRVLDLPEFSREQVSKLARLHQVDIKTNVLQALIDLLGGHPALLEKVFSHLRTHPDVSMQQLLIEAPTESSLLSAHLRQQLFALQSIPALAQAFQQVVTSEQPVTLAPKLVYQLQSMGLIKLSGNVTTPRCQLYQQYFKERLTGLAEQVS